TLPKAPVTNTGEPGEVDEDIGSPEGAVENSLRVLGCGHLQEGSLMSEKDGRRQRLDRDAVLAAAEQVVTTRGWAGLTMAAVAAEVVVRVPSLYHHVGAIEELRSALQVRTMRRLSDAF